MKQYTEGYELKEDEFLLKLRTDSYREHNTQIPTGYITKFNKNGSMAVDFANWGISRWSTTKEKPLPIFIHKETYRTGWQLSSWRFGKSQQWAAVIHPDGFLLEIYLSQFLQLALNNTIVDGELIGEFRWEGHKLIKKS